MKDAAKARHLVPITAKHPLAAVQKHDGGHKTRGVMAPCALVYARHVDRLVDTRGIAKDLFAKEEPASRQAWRDECSTGGVGAKRRRDSALEPWNKDQSVVGDQKNNGRYFVLSRQWDDRLPVCQCVLAKGLNTHCLSWGRFKHARSDNMHHDVPTHGTPLVPGQRAIPVKGR